MTVNNKSLTKIISKGIGEEISNINIEDVEAEKHLENLDELKQGMIFSINFVLYLKKEIEVTSKYLVVDKQRIHFFNARAHEALEETEEFMKKIFEVAKEISEVLTDSLKSVNSNSTQS